jgi:HD superfamily phosphodiesterase
MKLKSIATIINHAFNYVIKTSNQYKIDESHALKHSMEVYNYANKIYKNELNLNPYLDNQKEIIYASAILHDMCDKKYMSEFEGIDNIKKYMSGYMCNNDLNIVGNIISTMSYSKVIKSGFTDLAEYQMAYHIVREADLLASYDVDRAIIYGIYKEDLNYSDSLKRSIDIFENRVFKYISNNLFVTNYSKKEAIKLHIKALDDIQKLKEIILYP